MISIVIPLYNKAAEIQRTLQSVLAQTSQDFEVVVVDDGSSDGSVSVVESISDPRIRLVRQANAGVSAARNRGISEAKGPYIALIDADDEWQPDYLDTQLALINKYPDCDVFCTDYVCADSNGHVTKTIIKRLPFEGEDGELSNYFEVAACSNPPIWTSAVVFSKTAIEAIGGFPVGVKSGEDLLTWARLACRYKIAYSKKALAVFNIEGYEIKEKPKRVPAENDIVGLELKRLQQQFDRTDLRIYRSMWHKMRASVYMRLGLRSKSIKETCKAITLSPSNYKLYAYLFINLLPKKIQPF